MIQAVCDVAHRPLRGLRILDLGCAHGAYSIELATRGAEVLGIEGREAWLEQARRLKQDAALSNVEFVQDDVRNLSKEKYGEFDVVLCLGILYHLDAPDVFDFVNRVAQVCRDFAIIETHFAGTPALSHEWREALLGRLLYRTPRRCHPRGQTQIAGCILGEFAILLVHAGVIVQYLAAHGVHISSRLPQPHRQLVCRTSEGIPDLGQSHHARGHQRSTRETKYPL